MRTFKFQKTNVSICSATNCKSILFYYDFLKKTTSDTLKYLKKAVQKDKIVKNFFAKTNAIPLSLHLIGFLGVPPDVETTQAVFLPFLKEYAQACFFMQIIFPILAFCKKRLHFIAGFIDK